MPSHSSTSRDSRLGSLLSKRDIARIGNVSVRTVERLIERGELKAVRMGGQVRITLAAFEQYLSKAAS
jgi:excisionase family DNA binding protein